MRGAHTTFHERAFDVSMLMPFGYTHYEMCRRRETFSKIRHLIMKFCPYPGPYQTYIAPLVNDTPVCLRQASHGQRLLGSSAQQDL